MIDIAIGNESQRSYHISREMTLMKERNNMNCGFFPSGLSPLVIYLYIILFKNLSGILKFVKAKNVGKDKIMQYCYSASCILYEFMNKYKRIQINICFPFTRMR